MKISKRTREGAAMVCAIAASTPADLAEAERWGLNYPSSMRPTYDEVGKWLGWLSDDDRVALAECAWTAVFDTLSEQNWTPEIDAEAEALLRDGWCPGDPVYRL